MVTIKQVRKFMNDLIEEKVIPNQQSFGESLGYKNKSSFSQLLNKEEVSDVFVSKIKQVYPEFNTWLLTGEGEMLNSNVITNNKGNVVLGDNNTGSISNNTMIGNIGNINGRNSIGTPIVETNEVVDYNNGVPYYNIDFINGFTSVEEVTHHNAEYNINYPPANHCEFWVNATGDSMRGVIDNGDKIALKLVDKEWFPLGEVYAIITTNGHRMVKKIAKSEDKECYRLVSANPDKNQYPDQDIPKRMIQTLFKVVTTIKFIN